MSTPTAPALHVHGLEKSFKDVHGLRGVDFDVAPASIFALLGSNGAGTTTVVNILATLLKADAGVATVTGFDVVTQPANVRESIRLTGQFAAVDEILTGRENLALIVRLRDQTDTGSIADELPARFQLTDAADRRVATYSGGMRRRLDIAMSLIGDPPVIFLDEGPIIANGTLAELKQLLPPTTVQYVEKQPTLEDVFLAIVGTGGSSN